MQVGVGILFFAYAKIREAEYFYLFFRLIFMRTYEIYICSDRRASVN